MEREAREFGNGNSEGGEKNVNKAGRPGCCEGKCSSRLKARKKERTGRRNVAEGLRFTVCWRAESSK